jgi:hypothetical protein
MTEKVPNAYARCITRTPPATMSSSFTYVPPCMIVDDDELEQAQQIRETFSKGRSYAAVAASSASWRVPPAAAAVPAVPVAALPAPEFAHHSRVFGTSQPSSNRIGAGGFPNAFHSYGTRPGPLHMTQEGSGGAAAAAIMERRRRHESKDPPGTLMQTVRMTFYNSERGSAPAAPPPLTIPAESTVGGPFSPKTPPYYDEQAAAELYGGPAAHTPQVATATAENPATE